MSRYCRIVVALGLLAAFAGQPVAAKDTPLQAWPTAHATPALQLEDLNGKQWRLADLRGKVVVVSFWATWCEYCAEEMAFLDGVAKSEADKLVVLGVNYKEPAERVRRSPVANRSALTLLLDPSGQSFAKWGGAVLPTTVLVDRKGKARWRAVGALDASDSAFRDALAQLLKE